MNKNSYLVITGVIIDIISAIVFLMLIPLPVLGPQIGTHQIDSWTAMVLLFVGMILILYGGSGEQ
ncbi:MAG: hypothetical protein JRN01_06340 [Nitrososphaerota archaeon]|nr:hypothetical protein [Nitrososphaerota archaeon]